MKIHILSQKGFTLVEFLIYIVILAAILVLITGFLWLVVLGNTKESSFQEIQQNGRFALAKINQEIKKATGVINPIFGDHPQNSLLLSMADGSTRFDLSNEKPIITQGSPPVSYELTSDQVIVKELQFTNMSYSGTPGTIRVEMTIDYANPANLTERKASIDLRSTVSLLPGWEVP